MLIQLSGFGFSKAVATKILKLFKCNYCIVTQNKQLHVIVPLTVLPDCLLEKKRSKYVTSKQ